MKYKSKYGAMQKMHRNERQLNVTAGRIHVTMDKKGVT